MQSNTRKLTVLSLLSALAYIVMVVGRIPVVLFLKYDPKDVVITIGGFLFGPLAAFAMSLLVSFIEMLTVSDTGPIGLLMNVISTCMFACTAAFIYKMRHTMKGAFIGLIAGCITATIAMLLWNYFVTPLYLGVPRDAVVQLLVPAILPFNLLKGGLNAALSILLYKPLKLALTRTRLMPTQPDSNPKINVGATLAASFAVATGVMLILVFQGRI